MTPDPPKIVIIAGPNGAGKTTFARAFLPEEAQCPRFINADLIAAGLSPFAPEAAATRAGRVMLDELASCAQRHESFAFETTLSGLSYHVSLFPFLPCPAPKWLLRAWPSVFGKAVTTFLKTSSVAALKPGAGTLMSVSAAPLTPGPCMTIAATNLCFSNGVNDHD